jgi:hypothetical protein
MSVTKPPKSLLLRSRYGRSPRLHPHPIFTEVCAGSRFAGTEHNRLREEPTRPPPRPTPDGLGIVRAIHQQPRAGPPNRTLQPSRGLPEVRLPRIVPAGGSYG